MIEIKELGIEAYDEIYAFNKLCFPTEPWKEEDWKDLLQDERSVYYALMDEDKLVGNIFIYNWAGEMDYIKIMNVSVHPDYRKQGLCERLMLHMQNQLKEYKLRFCGETRASNIGMQKTFEKCGYQLDKIEEGYYQNPDESAYKYILEPEKAD